MTAAILAGAALSLTSPAFPEGGEIPAVHTCDGRDLAPALAWTGVPEGTRSLALIVEDPDAPDPRAPRMTWTHWVLYDIPPSTAGIPEGGALPPGTREGRNDWKRTGYGGPCPPVGRHRYIHRLFALDAALPDLHGPDRASLLQAIDQHVLAEARLTGTYQRRK